VPTITFELSVQDPRVHRRIAKTVSLWLHQQGVDLNHVLTKFLVLGPESAYSGPFPLAGTAPEKHGFAFVRCVVSDDRGPGFRLALAAEITASLQPEVRPDRVFVHFDLIDPELHLLGTAALSQGGGERILS
jgi:hypothetical protein